MGRSENRARYRKYFASQLKQVMHNRYLSIERLSQATGISKQSLCNYLAAKTLPSVYELGKMCIVLEVYPEVLMFGTGDGAKIIKEGE